MGSICRKSFISHVAAKTKAEATAKRPRPQRQTFCRICGKLTAGKKICQSCGDFIKGKEV